MRQQPRGTTSSRGRERGAGGHGGGPRGRIAPPPRSAGLGGGGAHLQVVAPDLLAVVVLDSPLVDGGAFDDGGRHPTRLVAGQDVDAELVGEGVVAAEVLADGVLGRARAVGCCVDPALPWGVGQIGRASWRERVW